MKEKLYLLFCGLCITFGSFAQTIIKGTITDEKGLPFEGVTIVAKPSGLRASSNAQGQYSITVKNSKTDLLSFNYIGYVVQEIPVAGKTVIDIKLLTNVSKLDEVVVTALNLSRKTRSIGYSQQTVNVDNMTEARSPNITDMLSGQVAGLQIVSSGQATGSTKVVLRGVNSLTGNNEPLWVVDGIPIENNSGQNGGIGNIDYGNGASSLNPDDIESMEVLKGPNAAALYGSRAANGAILVITKKGKLNQGVGVSFNTNLMFNTITELPELQNVYGEGTDGHMANTNAIDFTIPGGSMRMGRTDRSFGAPMLGQPYASYAGVPGLYLPHPDNISDIYHTSLTAIQNIAVGTSDQTSSFRLSYTRTYSNDVIEKQNVWNKHNLALTASKTFKPWFKIDTRLQYADEKVENRVFRNLDPNSPMNAALVMMRSFDVANLQPWKDANGDSFAYTANGAGYENPYWSINENHNQDRKSRVIGGVTGTIGLFKFLKFRAQIAADMNYGKGFVFLQKGGLRNKFGQFSQFNENNQTWTSEGLFMFDKKVKDFSIVANLGGSDRKLNNNRSQSQINALAVHDVMNINNALANIIGTEQPQRSETQSIFGTATIGYKNYLFLDLTGRNDWSSTLDASNRSYFYPSISASFVFSDFFKIKSDVLSFGKIRASFAQVGKDTNPYSLLSAFSSQPLFNGYPIATFDNTERRPLKPEQTASSELGLEMQFFKNRLSLDATVYSSKTKNQLFRAQVAPETGYFYRYLNAGEVSNKGVEMSLKGTLVNSRNFSWSLIGNWSINRNMVLSMASGTGDRVQLGNANTTTVNAIVGRPIGDIRGSDMYRDANGNVIVNPINGRSFEDKDVYLGNYLPNWLGSLGSNVRYKNFDLSFTITVREGGQIYSASMEKANGSGTSLNSIGGRDDYYFSNVILGESGDELKGSTTLYGKPYPDASRPKGMLTPGFYPKVDGNGQIVYDANGRMIAGAPNQYYILPSTYWTYTANMASLIVYDASFVKLNQIILGYSLPSKFLIKTPFQTARISLVGRNIWTIYKKTPRGIDPESSSSAGNDQGLEKGGSLPYASYGIDLKFSF